MGKREENAEENEGPAQEGNLKPRGQQTGFAGNPDQN